MRLAEISQKKSNHKKQNGSLNESIFIHLFDIDNCIVISIQLEVKILLNQSKLSYNIDWCVLDWW